MAVLECCGRLGSGTGVGACGSVGVARAWRSTAVQQRGSCAGVASASGRGAATWASDGDVDAGAGLGQAARTAVGLYGGPHDRLRKETK